MINRFQDFGGDAFIKITHIVKKTASDGYDKFLAQWHERYYENVYSPSLLREAKDTHDKSTPFDYHLLRTVSQTHKRLCSISTIPIYHVVKPYVKCLGDGENLVKCKEGWRSLSPFTSNSMYSGKSLFLYKESNSFKCHSTGLSGDAIRFIQEIEKLSFFDAIRYLIERFNIPEFQNTGELWTWPHGGDEA